MNRSALTILVALGFIALDIPVAHGETPQGIYRYQRMAKGKRKPRTQRQRKLASLRTRNRFGNMKAAAKRRRSNQTSLVLGLVTGHSSTSTNMVASQVSRDAAGYNQNIYLGVEGDLRLSKYVGIDMEGYFGLANSQSFDNSERSVQPYGLMGDVYGRIPFYASRDLKLVPRAGVGFGAHFIGESILVNGAEFGQSSRVLAPYGVVGLEFVFFRRLTLSTDLAMSAFGDGVFAPRTGQDQDVANPSFTRVRLGLDYRVSVPVSVGAEYTRRDMEFQIPGNSFNTVERSDQLLGVLKFHF